MISDSLISYFPVLRWKQAEKAALASISPAIAEVISPIIEFVPTSLIKNLEKGKSVGEFFSQGASDIFQYWGAKCYLDIQHLDPLIRERNHPYSFFEARRAQLGFEAIPVMGLSEVKENSFLSYLRNERIGSLALRITKKDLGTKGLRVKISGLLDYLSLSTADVTLIYDCGVVGKNPTALARSLGRIPDLNGWKEVVSVGGSFPLDLSDLNMGEHVLPRREWQYWLDSLSDLRTARIAKYGDFTVQHPIFTEKLIKFLPSPSIRYTTGQSFLVMRGKLKYGSAQYLAHAQQLCHRPEFKGAEFSSGDRFMFEKSQELEREGDLRTGNSKDWLSAAISHHFPEIVSQIETVAIERAQRITDAQAPTS